MGDVFAVYSWLKQEQPWLLMKQCDPKKWGRYGWQSIIGMIWYVCFHQPELFPHAWNMLQWVAAFLLCKYCSKHFYASQVRYPLDYQTCLEQPHLLFEWICVVHEKVHQRLKDCGESCDIQQWIDGKSRNTNEWKIYFEKRIGGHSAFRSLWIFDVLLFYTTTIRCVIAPEKWRTQHQHYNGQPILEYGFRSYIASVCHILFTLVADSKTKAKTRSLISPSLPTESENTNAIWSHWWIHQVMIPLFKQHKQQRHEALKVVESLLTLSQRVLPVYIR